mmetsp:Transcript_13181/g.38452  ORF Transcript_13181/g.38452 Transcript_13181/m.38452 type:complete len:688 (-) Transcript_13181:122-2185(-)
MKSCSCSHIMLISALLIPAAAALDWQTMRQVLYGVEWLDRNKDRLSNVMASVATAFDDLFKNASCSDSETSGAFDVWKMIQSPNATMAGDVAGLFNSTESGANVEALVQAVRKGGVQLGEITNKFKEFTEATRLLVSTMNGRGSAYDIVIGSQDDLLATDLGRKGWPTDINNMTAYRAFQQSSKPVKVISVVGYFKDGKTWLVNQLGGFFGASGFAVFTKPLSIKLPDMSAGANDNRVFVDIAGRGRMGAGGHNVDQRGTDQIVEDLALDLGDIILCVVGKFTVEAYDYVRALARKVYGTWKEHKKELVIVHNYQVTEPDVVRSLMQKDIVEGFNAYKDYSDEEQQLPVFWHTYEGDPSIKIRHIVFGHELSLCAHEFNTPSLKALENIITYSVAPTHKWSGADVKDLVRKKLEVRMRDYFLPAKYVSEFQPVEPSLLHTIWAGLRNKVTYWVGASTGSIEQEVHEHHADYELVFSRAVPDHAPLGNQERWSMRLKDPRTLQYRRRPGPGNAEMPYSSAYDGPCDWIVAMDIPGTATVSRIDFEDELAYEEGKVTFMAESEAGNSFLHVSGIRARHPHHRNTSYYTCRHLRGSSRFEPFIAKIALPAGGRVTFGDGLAECAKPCDAKPSLGELHFHVDLSGQKACKEYKRKVRERQAAKKAASEQAPAKEEAKKAEVKQAPAKEAAK